MHTQFLLSRVDGLVQASHQQLAAQAYADAPPGAEGVHCPRPPYLTAAVMALTGAMQHAAMYLANKVRVCACCCVCGCMSVCVRACVRACMYVCVPYPRPPYLMAAVMALTGAMQHAAMYLANKVRVCMLLRVWVY